MINKVLVANRGEIAVRIIQTLKEMNIKTVAIYSTADEESIHVQIADEAINVGAPAPQESYLNRNNIISAALVTGCDAIHPGYGFLSEDAEFAKMVQETGLKWIGPSYEIINLMGNKSEARRTMIDANVPVIPGSKDYVSSLDEALEVAKEVGYPVFLKAASGGGGKGMRVVETPKDMQSSFQDAKREAVISFNDDRLYIEKVMNNVRHIEMQILRDSFGNTIYFPERNCSLQRNHQKLIEESPTKGMTDKTRKKLGEISIQVANAVNYENTGTIEFLEDNQGDFYFMEMNTRIQVEHTVSEEVTNQDIVRLQIEVAEGKELTITSNDLKPQGCAMEARLNSEIPERNFQPSTGTITNYFIPTSGHGIRVDTGIKENSKISPFYDSMIAKIIVSDHTRESVLNKMKRVLSGVDIQGVGTNLDFQKFIVGSPAVKAGNFTTETIEKYLLPEFDLAKE